ncbi:MAG: glycosyltransferase, partial [bacterium]|nr:glycosyltransferase [bacterium]
QNAHKIKLSGQKNISIVDIDPGDSTTVLELFKKATLFIAPIFGPGGTRLKILAAMGSGIPVISTKTGVEGLAVENNKHVILAETSEDFSIKIAEILSSKNKYESIRLNAYMLVKEQYNWKKIAQKLETVYQDL